MGSCSSRVASLLFRLLGWATGDQWSAERRGRSGSVSPPATSGYNRQNRLRVESADEAARLDALILDVWSGHPRRFIIDSTADFVAKATRALELVKAELPSCCQVDPLAPG
jgi:hypothetical protein